MLVLLSGMVSRAWAGLPVLLYDDFDDGDYSGWTVTDIRGAADVRAPDVVASPEGYSVRGTGSGYHPDWACYLARPISLQNARNICIEMRARSGPAWPNAVTVDLFDGQDFYAIRDYGESNHTADWMRRKDGQWVDYRHPIGERAHEWHTFAWTRDSDGWWSLSIDGVVEAANFRQDLEITSFDHVELELHRDQSEIEWVRISGVREAVPVEWRVADGGNGHYYERVDVPEGIVWPAARTEAESRFFNGSQGYLATITSGAENQFIFDNLIAADTNPASMKYFIGGFLDGSWQWVTGEVWSYSNWWVTEPSGDGTALEIASSLAGPESKWGTWNDEPCINMRGGYIVEYVPEPTEGWIAFNSNEDGDYDIWAVRPDGTGLRELVDMPGAQNYFQWSPDSRWIVYSSDQEAQLWVYDWCTDTNTKIYDADDYGGAYGVYLPAWSPDGSKILFREDASYNNPHITLINADGTGRAVVPVESGYVGGPSWSPDGTAFVYDRRNSGASHSHDLWIYDFAGTGDIMSGTNHRLTGGAGSESTTKFSSDWTPRGDIVFCWGHNLAIIDPGQSPAWNGPISNPLDPHVTFLTNDASYPSIRYMSPSWSPCLSYITYGYATPDGAYDIGVMDISDLSAGIPYPAYALTSTPDKEWSADWGNPPSGLAVHVELDIRPGSYPNPLNVRSKGVLPVAILGSEALDVSRIDVASIRLAGVAPIRSSYEDITSDGYTDLALKFKTPEIVEAIIEKYGEPTKGQELTLSLEGVLYDETPIEGSDVVVIVGKVPNSILSKKADVNGDGVVNMLDFVEIATQWMKPAAKD